MKKILGITGTRADYDLLSSLYRKLRDSPSFDLKLMVGGAHMSSAYGHSIDLIRDDQIDILMSIESLIDGDSISSRLKSASIFLSSIIDTVANWKPDLILYAGDREEVWIGALLGAYLDIPTIHFYGGDHTQSGYVDNPIRHATSKLSSAHFVSTEEHKSRLMAIGEDESRIFVTGSLALDNFVNTPLLNIDEVNNELNTSLTKKSYAIVLFHPILIELGSMVQYMKNIIEAGRKKGIFLCIGYPNSDPANKGIVEVIESYRSNCEVYIYKNLRRDIFLSLYKHAAFIIGNSSSGVIEAASIPIPAIDVGDRQKGRAAGINVISCSGDIDRISAAIDEALSDDFRYRIESVSNPYGNGSGVEQAYNLISEIDFTKLVMKREDPLKLAKDSHGGK